MVPTIKKLYKVLIDVKYKYDVDTKGIKYFITHNNENQLRGGN